MVNHETREIRNCASRRAMGMIQSVCRKVRCSSAGDSRGGAHQFGIRLAMPNCWAGGDWRRYWFHSRPSKAPVSAAISPAAT